jgi:retron-type reverse transcriptase
MSGVVIDKQSRPVTAAELLDALNDAKTRVYADAAVVWPFTMPQMLFFSNPRKNCIFYHRRSVPKKSGGVREISSPTGMLKAFQSAAGKMLQDLYDAPDAVTGFVPGRSVIDNAARHVRKNYVYNADLKDFFPGISRKRVKGALMRPPFSFGEEAANILSGICCSYKGIVRTKRDWIEEAEHNGPGRPPSLPQGAPSSPVLSNAVCIRLDQRLEGLARRYEVSYSRYADDITFSSDHNVFREGYSFLKEFRRIITDEGLTLNEEKLRLQERGQRQEVTGLIVNSKVNVCRKYVRSIGSLLYIWERYGVDAAYARFLKHSTDWKHARLMDYDGEAFRPHMVETVQGRLAYLRMIKGKDDPVWSRLNDRFLKLKKQNEDRGVVGNPTRILHSWTIKRFEQLSGIILRYGDLHSHYDYSLDHAIYDRCFLLEKNGLQTYVYPSRYCRTRMNGVLETGDAEEFERLKSEFRIGLCTYNLLPRYYALAEFMSQEETERVLERRTRSLVHTYSRTKVCWKIFRRPPDIEDLPY